MESMYRIGEAAEMAGLSTPAIRFYESQGVLPQPERTESGYRGYSTEDVDLIRFVSRLRALEFPLGDVREIVGLRRDDTAPCAAVRSTLARELVGIEARIEALEDLRTELQLLEEKARDLPDDWPTNCVCNVIEEQP